ncbi:MAG: hypothetical protein COB14_07410 [Alphaproteobacteria bacterium]|nr:MAG: hypothetical protein COB14_07410 [Alphaproteobacteria bacterium]
MNTPIQTNTKAVIDRLLEDQAKIVIGWEYDFLVRDKQSELGGKELSQSQKAILKNEAIRRYTISNQDFINEMRMSA